MDRKLWFACVLFVTCQIAIALDVTVQQFKELPGLYYEYIGEARMYSTEWKVVTYINMQTVDENFRTVRNFAQMSADFCKSMSINFGLITLGV